MSYIARVPSLLFRISRNLNWKVPTEDKEIYLTFDDGPTPEVTRWVLSQLKEYGAEATFFCLGKNVKANPDIYLDILEAGHMTGNHSFSHAKGFRTRTKEYVENVKLARDYIDSRLFRPPYGRILPSQINALRKDYDIIMWSVLSVDYDRTLDVQEVVNNVLNNVFPGAIVVFHDSVKASKNLYAALPIILKELDAQGYKMHSLKNF